MVDHRADADAVRDARRSLAAAQARLAEAMLTYADARRATDRRDPRFGVDSAGRVRARAGEFAGDELAVMLLGYPWTVRRLAACSRRVRSGLPTVWSAHRAGDIDTEQVRVIDRAARRAIESTTVEATDAGAVDAARTRTPKQLASWLLRLVVECEPLAFAERHRRALAERRVTISQGPDGVGYVTGVLSAADTAQVDALLTALARTLGPGDARTEQQRRADLMADLLLGRLAFDDADPSGSQGDEPDAHSRDRGAHWVEVEDVDLDTGELLGTHQVAVDATGEPLELPSPPARDPRSETSGVLRTCRRPQTVRIGVVVPLGSLLGLSDSPGQLPDRSGAVPAESVRDSMMEALAGGDQVLVTRLLTDDGGRLLDTTELGRHPSRRLAEAVTLRAATCRHPTCTVPADQCDLDHHEPHPRGPTAGHNLDPGCRRHHRGKTFAWLVTVRDRDAVDWTLPDATVYRCLDDPLPTGMPAAPRAKTDAAALTSPRQSGRVGP